MCGTFISTSISPVPSAPIVPVIATIHWYVNAALQFLATRFLFCCDIYVSEMDDTLQPCRWRSNENNCTFRGSSVASTRYIFLTCASSFKVASFVSSPSMLGDSILPFLSSWPIAEAWQNSIPSWWRHNCSFTNSNNVGWCFRVYDWASNIGFAFSISLHSIVKCFVNTRRFEVPR